MNILTEEAAIEGKNIIKDFQLGDTKTRVLKNISLKVIQGEFVSIMGQSGSGKSTLLYILGGLDVPTSGSVFMNGMDISKFNDEKLSGGQQQRVAIARALIGNPEILFADEPTGNLDSHTGAEIMSLLQRINKERGQTIIMVTHSPEAAKSSSRVITVSDGLLQ